MKGVGFGSQSGEKFIMCLMVRQLTLAARVGMELALRLGLKMIYGEGDAKSVTKLTCIGSQSIHHIGSIKCGINSIYSKFDCSKVYLF